MAAHNVIGAPGSQRQEKQFKIIFRYIVSSRPAWTTYDPVLKNKMKSKQELRLWLS